MAKHHPDLIMCRKQPGIAIGRLCEKCDGKCVICDSYVRPCTLVRVCDECNYGSFQGRCVICGGVGISDAYYCKECTQQEKDRDGCPKIVNLGSAKTDLFYEHINFASIAIALCLILSSPAIMSRGAGALGYVISGQLRLEFGYDNYIAGDMSVLWIKLFGCLPATCTVLNACVLNQREGKSRIVDCKGQESL
uniref:Zinc finger CCCH domain-containing protein 30 n=1 Tax=Populus alba TaxID=43335 RepID=A0A4U5QH41_POPAL|nr:Zinc finger CCCH domain-containing protein 30 [Populus alba]